MSKNPAGTLTLTLLAVAAVLLAPGAEVAAAQGNQASPAEATKLEGFDYETLSNDLQAASGLFSGGKGKAPAAFDRDGAAGLGLSPQSIQLAEEMAAFTNELMAGPAGPRGIVDVGRGQLDVRRYPMLAYFFALAAQHHRDHPADDTLDEPAPDASVRPLSWLTEFTCGAVWRPRPSTAAPWVGGFWAPDPAATLRGWGYHPTPSVGFGGGWTRPHSYSWALCGFDTYRDHAQITGPNTLAEQLYVGWTPPGEPNPEIYASGPWPYVTWPAYVYWWHNTH